MSSATSALERTLSGSPVLTGADAVPYLRDTSSAEPGSPLGVVLAESAADVAAAVAWAHERRIPVVPRGTGTGVSGGATALTDCLVISTEPMDSIIEMRRRTGSPSSSPASSSTTSTPPPVSTD